MFDKKLQLSQLHVGTDISEVRNQIDSIRQYLLTSSIQIEIFDLFVKKTKEIKEKDELLLNKDEQETENEKISMFPDFTSLDDSKKKQLFSLVSIFTSGMIDLLADAIQMRPMRVNFMQLMLVEMWFAVSNKLHDPITSYKIIDGKIQMEKTSEKDIFKDRIEILVSDMGRKIHLLYEAAFTAQLSDEDIQKQSEAVFRSNMSSNDPLFGQYFAFTFSQCSVYDVQEFLDYQKEQYHRDFNSFLSITALKYKDLLTEEHIVLAQEWLSKSAQQTVESQQAQEVKIETESMTSAVLSEQTYTPINGKLSAKEINRFFDFLHEQKSKNKQPFMPKDKVAQLLTHGFSIPVGESTKRFTINMTEQEYWIIYTCFYELWVTHSIIKRGKEDYAIFLKSYFTNFDKTDISTIKTSLKTDFLNKMPFKIYGDYLPNR
jgi:hypothetical protein